MEPQKVITFGEARCMVCGKFLHYVEGLRPGEVTHGYCRKHYLEASRQVKELIERRKREQAEAK